MQDPTPSPETSRDPTTAIKPLTAIRPKRELARQKSPLKRRPSPPKSQKKNAAKKEKTQPELIARLKRLRQVTRETAQAYLLKIDAALAAIIRGLEENDPSAKDHSPKTSSIKQMLKLLKRIDPKPVKGRRKDLRRIEKAVEAMTHLMPKVQLRRADQKIPLRSRKTR
jgi:hypothetical protein